MTGYWYSIARNCALTIALLSLTACAGMGGGGGDINDEAELADAAADVIEAQMNEPMDQRIPSELLAEARCIAVFPSVTQAGFIVGGKRGGGLISCRENASGEWSDTVPVFYNITGASVGLQAGVQSTKLILLVMDEVGVQQIVSGSVTLGSEIGVVAGPVGGNIGVSTNEPIIAYSRSKGLFAGINLGGSTIGYNGTSNADVYGPMYSDADAARNLMYSSQPVPAPIEVYNDALSELTAQ